MALKKLPIEKTNPILKVLVHDGTELVVKKRIILIELQDRYTLVHVWNKKTNTVKVIRSITRSLNAYNPLLMEQFIMMKRQSMVNLLHVEKVSNERRIQFKMPVAMNCYMSREYYSQFLKLP